MINKEDIVARECKFAVYCRPPKGASDDYHLVKERLHLKDGTTVPNVRLVRNFKRSFWLTTKGRRVHQQKKEREYLVNLKEYQCTESKLVRSIAKALGKPYFQGTLRDLADSPYLYGTDKLSTALIKDRYREKFPEAVSFNSVAVFDTETFISDGTIIMATISFKDKVYTACQAKFFEGISNAEMHVQQAFEKYLGKYKEERNITLEFELVPEEIDVIRKVFAKAHEWRPDFLTMWNINFDMPKVMEACERAGVDPKDIFSDPSVPLDYRFFRYKEGKKIKIMASGKASPIGMADQWHTVYCPSSFYLIDSMCVYRRLRTGKEQPSYSLNYILGQELGERKLRFTQADKFGDGVEWHEFMQENYPVEYVIYNIFDCISVELLDEKTNDLAVDVPDACAFSDFASLPSQPTRVVDELHCYLLNEHASVLGTTSANMLGELDELTPPNKGMIVNLKAFLVQDEGLQCIKEFPSMRTRAYLHVYDLDVSSAYPSNTIVFNVSKETNKVVFCKLEGTGQHDALMSSINLSGGHTNSVEFVTARFDLPTMRNALALYKGEKKVVTDDGKVESVKA